MKTGKQLLALGLLLAATMSLSSCSHISGMFGGEGAKRAPSPPAAIPANNAAAFVENLSLIRLHLAANPENTGEIAAPVAAVKSYAQSRRKAEKVTLVLLDYRGRGVARHASAVLDTARGDYPSLQLVMEKWKSAGGVLQNIQLRSASVRPDKSLALKSLALPDGKLRLKAALDEAQSRLLSQAEMLPVDEDIRLQFSIIRFFVRREYRDAAYLSLDNVKRMLAAAARNKELDAARLEEFSGELEALEGHLKQTLPYRF